MYVMTMAVLVILYPGLYGPWSLFRGFVFLGVCITLLCTGGALCGDMAARKKFSLSTALLASAIALCASVVSLMTELAK